MKQGWSQQCNILPRSRVYSDRSQKHQRQGSNHRHWPKCSGRSARFPAYASSRRRGQTGGGRCDGGRDLQPGLEERIISSSWRRGQQRTCVKLTALLTLGTKTGRSAREHDSHDRRAAVDAIFARSVVNLVLRAIFARLIIRVYVIAQG